MEIVSARVHETNGYLVVTCPLGHLIEAHKMDKSFGGSMLEAELAARQTATSPDRFDRLAAKCGGFGHTT